MKICHGETVARRFVEDCEWGVRGRLVGGNDSPLDATAPQLSIAPDEELMFVIVSFIFLKPITGVQPSSDRTGHGKIQA